MANVTRTYTLDEAAKVLGKTREEVERACSECDIDLATRSPHRLTQAELDQIKSHLNDSDSSN